MTAPRIIAVLNQKGGVGKTTTCVNLGAALARRGKRVLLVDMDPQSNMTVHLGGDVRTVEKSTYSLLLAQHPLGPAVTPTSTPGLMYVPSTLALANAEIQLASVVGRELLLREAIEGWMEGDLPDPGAGAPNFEAALGAPPAGDGMLDPRAHFVLIDCPPSLGILTMNALCAAGEVLLPIQAEFFALQGIAGILESLRAVQRLNRGLRLSMVLPCMVDRRRTLARDVLEEVQKYFGNLVTKVRIRSNVKLAEAPSHGQTIFEYDKTSNGAQDYDQLALEVLGEAVEIPDEEPVAESAPEPAPLPPAGDDVPPAGPLSASAVPLPPAPIPVDLVALEAAEAAEAAQEADAEEWERRARVAPG